MEVSRILPIFAARLRSWRRALDDGGPVNTGLWVRQTHEQLFLTLNVTLWIKTYGTWGLQEVRDIDQLENVVNQWIKKQY